MVKWLKKFRREGVCLIIIKVLYVCSVFNEENVWFLENKIKERIKGMKIEKKKIKLFLFVEDMILYLKDFEEFIKIFLSW